MRPMAEAVPATALVDGPSHESSLPGRPPYHWLRPPRESVVNALLPWRNRAMADSFRPGPRSRRAVPMRDRRGLSEREQRLLETDHRLVWVSSQDRNIPARALPAPPGEIAECAENRRPRRNEGGRRHAPAPRLPRAAIRTGPPVTDRTGSSRPIPGGARTAPPRRCGSLAPAAPIRRPARRRCRRRSEARARLAIPLRPCVPSWDGLE